MKLTHARIAAALIASLSFLGLNCTGAPASPSRIDVHSTGAVADGVTDDTAAINAAIDEAIKSGPGATVLLPKGVYRIATQAAGAKSIVVAGAQNLTIKGEPGTKIMVDSAATAFDLHDCKGLTISHLIVDHDPMLYTQGTITAADPVGFTCEVEIEKGYEDPDAPIFTSGVALKPFIYPGADNYQQDHYIPGVQSMQKIGDHKFRFTLKQNGVVGDWVGKPCVLDGGGRGWCFMGRNLQDWTVSDVQYWGGGGQACWYIRGLTGTTTFNHLMVRVPPGSGRLYCCAGGGQISGLRGKLLIENSEFTACR